MSLRKLFRRTAAGFCLSLALTAPQLAFCAPAEALRAGAARVDITPASDVLPVPYTSVRDHLFVRAIVVDDGITRAVLIGIDLIVIDQLLWEETAQQIARELACPVDNIVMSATHSHSSPYPEDGKKPADPNYAAFRAKMKDGILAAVREAKGKLQPARLRFATGTAYLNVNRDAVHPQTRLWYQGPNPDGPSDKTVAVLTVEDSNGAPIALYVNYAMHAIDYYEMGVLTADFPGVTSRMIERAYDDKAVAIWSSGAAGDQNPLYLRQHHEAREAKAAMAKNPSGPGQKTLSQAVEELNTWVDTMGRLMSEEVLRVNSVEKDDPTAQPRSSARIAAIGKTVTCPGRTRTNTGREGAPGTYVDGEPVNLHVGVLTLGTTAFVTVNAEIYTSIAGRLKKASPFSNTILVTLANGFANSGYVPSDEAFSHNTFQVLDTHLKPGCAENGIIDAARGMMAELGK